MLIKVVVTHAVALASQTVVHAVTKRHLMDGSSDGRGVTPVLIVVPEATGRHACIEVRNIRCYSSGSGGMARMKAIVLSSRICLLRTDVFSIPSFRLLSILITGRSSHYLSVMQGSCGELQASN